ncbi:MAG: ferrous iron transport protein A [Myxococcota bacterium]
MFLPNSKSLPASGGISLAALEPGRLAVVVEVEEETPQGRRLADLGFVPRTEVRAVKRAPLGDPTVYDVRGTRLCLRRREANRVRVRPT